MIRSKQNYHPMPMGFQFHAYGIFVRCPWNFYSMPMEFLFDGNPFYLYQQFIPAHIRPHVGNRDIQLIPFQ